MVSVQIKSYPVSCGWSGRHGVVRWQMWLHTTPTQWLWWRVDYGCRRCSRWVRCETICSCCSNITSTYTLYATYYNNSSQSHLTLASITACQPNVSLVKHIWLGIQTPKSHLLMGPLTNAVMTWQSLPSNIIQRLSARHGQNDSIWHNCIYGQSAIF